ncbi:MAG: ABC transporter ATP-binding protein [Candidatus Hydrogenedentota bacterium]|nr:MAG: ABC transporter ATP-binding protein [Candidatus Hydrogenedentota bacterium]
MSFLKLENVVKHYQQGDIIVPAVRGITLEISKGEFTAIVGPSGSGKTTLLNCIGTLEKPTSGHIYFKGQNLAEGDLKSMSEFRLQNLGFIFQAYNLIPVFTAYENVEYVLQLLKVPEEERKSRIEDLFSKMGMESLMHRFPKEMSGGQQQRVAIARALIANAELILADEPTANLDSENTENLLDIMEKMCEETGSTFLFSTHDERVMRRAKRIITLTDGKVSHDTNHS